MAPWVPHFIQSYNNNQKNKSFVPFQLATTSKEGPRCRTVVFSDFLFNNKSSNVLCFNTDYRSRKVEELSESSRYEGCFYFQDTWEQYRFRGSLFLVSQNGVNISSANLQQLNSNVKYEEKQWENEMERQWAQLSRAAKSQYKTPMPGATVTEETSNQLDKLQRGVDGSNEDSGRENFAIVALFVESVDYLKLKHGFGGQRFLYTRIDDDLWDINEICP